MSDGLQHTARQIRRAGDRIRKAAEAGKDPSAEDLTLLNDYRAWHQPALEQCQRELVELFHTELEADPALVFISGRPLKTVEAITAKLVRDKTRLNTMQDIAGTRIVIPDLDLQQTVANLIAIDFKDKAARVAKDTRERGDEVGTEPCTWSLPWKGGLPRSRSGREPRTLGSRSSRTRTDPSVLISSMGEDRPTG